MLNKKMTKKLLAFMLVFLLSFISVNVQVLAYSNLSDLNNINSQLISEYQMIVDKEKEIEKEIKELKIEKSSNDIVGNINNIVGDDKELEELYKEKSEIKQMYEKLDEHIKSLKDLSKTDLEKFHYTAQQIEAIQNYDGSPEMMALASATLSIRDQLNWFYRDTTSQETRLQIYYTWWWNGRPVSNGHDCITAIWTNGYTNHENDHSVDYYSSATGKYVQLDTYNNVNLNSPSQLSFTFPMSKTPNDQSSPEYEDYYPDHGDGHINLKRLDYNNAFNDINFKIAYGHMYVSLGLDVNAGFTIATGGDYGIYLKAKVNTHEIKTDPEWNYWTRPH